MMRRRGGDLFLLMLNKAMMYTQVALVPCRSGWALPPFLGRRQEIQGPPQTVCWTQTSERIEAHDVFSHGSADIHSGQELLKYVNCHPEDKEQSNFQI